MKLRFSGGKDMSEYVKGKPQKSGNYQVRYKGREGRDDYTATGGGHWWNVGNNGGNDENVKYIPDSFQEL